MRPHFFALLAFALLLPLLGRAAEAPAVASLQDLDAIPYPRHVVAPVCPASLGPVVDRVEVAFVIDERGNVGRVEAVSGANPALREAAVAAIGQWHFDPPSRRGQATQVAARQVFAFGPPKDSTARTEMIMPEVPGSSGPPTPAPRRSGFLSFLYSLLPKAFQENPTLHVAVITELTGAGRQLALPTSAQPAYYLAQSFAYPDQGEDDPVSPETLRPTLARALAQGHYLPAGPGHPATLVLVLSWGSISEQSRPVDPKEGVEVLGRIALKENFLARAKLVGGDAFAHQVLDAINQYATNPSGPRPLEVLANRDPVARQLLAEATADCYFVVASAYDADATARGQRRLLWQTKITVNSQDLAMKEAVTALIRNGGPYFGREMGQAAILEVPLQAGGGVVAAR